jgi:hypothetical protein
VGCVVVVAASAVGRAGPPAAAAAVDAGPLLPGIAEGPGAAARPASCGLGAVWGVAHERLARLHAGVLCAGSVPCLQVGGSGGGSGAGPQGRRMLVRQ